MKTTMEYKGFYAQIMEAPRLVGDHVFELPSGRALPVYYADEFINYPENWMKGQGVFVVPVNPDKGLWFNWRMNDELNTAILPTVKGCNPITGLKTSGFHMEKYENICPKHGCDFMADRFCPECDFKWPDRNHQSMAPLWWDGYRADDGTVRQFFFTEEELRDVATHMIGKENTVTAFGFAFFTPKERREHPSGGSARGMSGKIFYLSSSPSPVLGSMSKDLMNDSVTVNKSFNPDFKAENKSSLGGKDTYGAPIACAGGPISAAPVGGEAFVDDGGEQFSGGIILDSALYEAPKKISKTMKKSGSFGESPKGELRGLQVNSTPHRPKPVRDVSVGAGAKIRQKLNHDSYPLDSWKEAPDASMTIYFVFQEKLEELKSKGMRDVTGNSEGMLKNVPVG